MAADGSQTPIIWMIKHWLFTTRLYSWALSTYSCWPTVDYSQQKAQLFHWQPIWAPSIKSSPADQNKLSSWVFCAKWRIQWRAKKALLRNAVQCTITCWSVKEMSRKIDGTGLCRQRQLPFTLVSYGEIGLPHNNKSNKHRLWVQDRKQFTTRLIPGISLT